VGGGFLPFSFLLREIIGVLTVVMFRPASDRWKRLQESSNFDYDAKVVVRAFFHRASDLGGSGKCFPFSCGFDVRTGALTVDKFGPFVENKGAFWRGETGTPLASMQNVAHG
jgi:hypothetical protein